MARILICCCTEHDIKYCPNCPSHGERITGTVINTTSRRKIIQNHNEDYWSYDLYPLDNINERIVVA